MRPSNGGPMWSIFDARTGRRVTMAHYYDPARAASQVAAWLARAEVEGRPGVAEMLPHLVVKSV